VVLGREERQRRRGHDVGDRRELVRRGLRLRDERGDHVGGRGQEQRPADDPLEWVQAEPQPRRYAEVPAASAESPEQVRMVVGVDPQQPAVRRHDLGREQVVDGEAVLAHEQADAAAQRDPADADRPGVAEPGREAVRARRGRVRARGQAPARPGGAPVDVDLEPPQRRDVEHDPALGDAVTRGAVAAAADGELGSRLAGVRDDARHVVRIGHADDRLGAAVDRAGEDGTCLVVSLVVRHQDPAVDAACKLGGGEHPLRVTARPAAAPYGRPLSRGAVSPTPAAAARIADQRPRPACARWYAAMRSAVTFLRRAPSQR
jgi:hypothetical protein